VQQVFRAEVGLSPKAYQRLARFRATLTSIDAAAGLGWPAFAAERGYYDQAHLIREFRAHAGLSPTTYLQRRGEQLNHVPLPW
jgi:methylphosphotriester-DNA--protein-cysteine methyltransferase